MIFPFFSLQMIFSLARQNKWKKMLNCNLCSPKTTYFVIFANFGQLWIVVYTAIMKDFEIFQLYMMIFYPSVLLSIYLCLPVEGLPGLIAITIFILIWPLAGYIYLPIYILLSIYIYRSSYLYLSFYLSTYLSVSTCWRIYQDW